MNSESNIIIFNTEKKQLENSTFTKKAIRAIPKSLSNDTLIKLCIYFSPMAYRGIETVVCDIYERLLDIPNNIISTHARHRCAEIEVKKADISKVLDFTYSIFNHYWISQAKRRKNNLST